jgi:hypothetical protein
MELGARGSVGAGTAEEMVESADDDGGEFVADEDA